MIIITVRPQNYWSRYRFSCFFFVKCKTVKCNFRVFLSKKYKKKKLIIFQFSFCNLHYPKSFRYAFV